MTAAGSRLAPGLIALAAACSHAPLPTDPAQVVVATLDDRTLTLDDFQRYLAANLAGDHDPEPSTPEGAAVMSRLFDAFVEERLLLLEADRRGLEVTDLEVEAYLRVDGTGAGGGESSPTRSDWEEASRRLKIEKLYEAVAGDLPPVSGEAGGPPPGQGVGGRTEEEAEGRRLRLRSLMLESPEEAARVSRDIRAGRVTFDEAIVAHTSESEQGLPVELAWGSLSDEHRAVLKNLKAGQVSRPLDVGGVSYLFRVEAWLKPDQRDPAAEAEQARVWMERRRQAEALSDILAQLQKIVEIRLNLQSLPFEYVTDDSVDPPAWNRVVEGSG